MAAPSQLRRPGRARAVAALIAATFVVAVTFGLNMPLLPPLIEALPGGGAVDRVALHAGLLAAVFTFALGAAAPVWGALSDRVGRRPLLLLGMGGFTATMLAFSAPQGLAALYAEQLLSGLAAAAILPVSNALIADLAPDDHWRASRLAWLNMALVAGFILGPVAGSAPAALLWREGATGLVVAPFVVAGAGGAVSALLLWLWIPRAARRRGGNLRPDRPAGPLLVLTFGVSAALGVFEVAVAIRGGRGLALTPERVGALFTVCSVVMFAAQAAVFAGRGDPRRTASFVAPAFVGVSLGLATAGLAAGPLSYATAVVLFAAGGGVLVPVLAYWVSRAAAGAQGAQLGRQTAAAGLGQALGSAFAGVMFQQSATSPWGLLAAAAMGLALAAYAHGLAPALKAIPEGV